MVFKREDLYFNGQKIHKQVLNKYISWEKILSAIKNGSDMACLIKDRLGRKYMSMLCNMKRDGVITATDKTPHAIYYVTEKGEQLIKDVKQYQKEKKDEERRMFEDC